MDFNEWLIFREMAQMSIRDEKGKPDEVMTVVGPVDAVDFRFEDYPKNTEAERNYIRLFYGHPMPKFWGKLPTYKGVVDYVIFDGDNLQKSPYPYIGRSIELKEDLDGYTWWDYAECQYKGVIVKQPLKRRLYEI